MYLDEIKYIHETLEFTLSNLVNVNDFLSKRFNENNLFQTILVHRLQSILTLYVSSYIFIYKLDHKKYADKNFKK